MCQVHAGHLHTVSASPVPAHHEKGGGQTLIPCCASGSLGLPGDRLGTELLLQVPRALSGLWASY